MRLTELDTFQLRFPRDLESDAAVAAFAGFTGIPHRARLILDLRATVDGITHRLAVSPNHRDGVLANLRAAIPSLRLTDAEPMQRLVRPARVQLHPFVAALRADDVPSIAAALLASLFPLGKDEAVHLRWHLRSGPRPGPGISGDSDLRGGRLKALRGKLASPGMNVYGELAVLAGSRTRRAQLAQWVASVLRSLATPYGHLLVESAWVGRLLRLLYLRGQYMNASELAATAGWPIGGPDLPGLTLGAAKPLVPAAELPRSGRLLGVSDFPGINRPVALPLGASTKGLYVLGPTGTGKTSLLLNLIASDLERGQGLVVIETNGDLISDVMDAVPSKRRDDIIVLDATDREFAVGFNPFASSAEPALIADQLGELFHRLWEAFWGPRTAQLTHMGLLTLAQRGGSTLLDLPRLYLDPRFRECVLADLDDPLGLDLDWQWFAALSDREQATIVSPLLNKVRAFTARPSIRAIVGQSKPALDMRRIIEQRKVLLVHIPKGLVGTETAQLLGCLLLTALWQAAVERVNLPPGQRHPFGLVVDEVQDFAAAPVPWDEMFAQGRKYGLSLTVAHQNLEQLPKELREVVLANARSKAVFALSASDAKVMERHFAPALTAEDLQALDAYSLAALIALDDGTTARPVTLRAPTPRVPLGSFEEVRDNSRRRYARPRSEVEERLRSSAIGRRRAASAPVGRKKRKPA